MLCCVWSLLSFYAMFCSALLCYVVLLYDTLCCLVFCAMLCCVMLCCACYAYAMLCYAYGYAMLCYLCYANHHTADCSDPGLNLCNVLNGGGFCQSPHTCNCTTVCKACVCLFVCCPVVCVRCEVCVIITFMYDVSCILLKHACCCLVVS